MGRKARGSILHIISKRDFYAGLLMIVLGAGAALEGQHYNIGTMRQMGPGFMPVALGIILVLVGILIAGGSFGGEGMKGETDLPVRPDWRGWGCIIMGPILFIIFGKFGGLVPATFACVFVSALGDRNSTLKATFILATSLTAIGAFVFSYLLQVPFPLIRGLTQ
jgi:hypothetical protein